MKPPNGTETAAPSTTTVTTTKHITVDPIGAERTTPNFWEYIEALKPHDWDSHCLYIYRTEPGPNSQVEKSFGAIVMPGGQQAQLSNQEESEYAIAQKWGGKAYRLILKKGNQRVTEGKINLPHLQPKYPPMISSDGSVQMISPGGQSYGSDNATAQVANKAIDTMAASEKQAVSVGIEALNAAATVVQRFSQADQRPTSNPMMDQLMTVMLARMTADPMEQFGKMLVMMRELRTATGDTAAGNNPIVDKILETGLERVLNPLPAPANNPTMSTELVRHLPALASEIGKVMEQWRFGMEAQRDAVALSQGQQPPPRPAMPMQPTALPSNPTQVNPGNPSNGEAPNMSADPPLEFIEIKLVELISSTLTPPEAADAFIGFVNVANPRLLAQLLSNGKEQLLQLFGFRPILKQIPPGPRLDEFLDAFLKYGQEMKEDAPAPLHKPN